MRTEVGCRVDLLQERDQIQQLGVGGVFFPCLDVDAVLDVGGKGDGVVVDDEEVGEGPVDDGELLDKVVVHLQAGVAVEAVVDERVVVILLDDVHERGRVGGLRGGEDDHLEHGRHRLQELVQARPQPHVDQRPRDGEGEVGIAQRFQRAVHQRLVEVQDERVQRSVGGLGRQRGPARGGQVELRVRRQDQLVQRVHDRVQLDGLVLVFLAVRLEQRLVVGVPRAPDVVDQASHHQRVQRPHSHAHLVVVVVRVRVVGLRIAQRRGGRK